MAVEDNLRDRAKEIRGAFEPSSVTNEAVGGLLLDIINFFLNYAGSGGEGGKPDARYWSKDELKVLDQYLYVLNDKIKAIYADESGDSELFKGHKWEDNFDQPLRTFDPVQFNSITSTEFESKVKGWLIDALGNAEFRDLLIRSFKSWNFAAGPLGAGVGMVNDDELQTDKLLVRKTMYVLEMMTQRMRFQGGIIVLSPATGFKIDSVEVFDTYYRVHCRPEDLNEFEVNDQARIQNFTGNNIKYLWSLVLSRGDDYIDISRVDKDGDGVPAEGDEIVQLGNRTNPDRQDAVLLSAVNGEVGIFTYYGINSFDLSNKEGSWLGKHGGKKGAVIRGEVHITAGSSGLEQFDEYEDVDKRIQDAKDLADSVQDVVNNLTSIIIPDMQGQIDGSIMSHEGKVPPTLTNEPAVNWTTEEEKNRHIGDYYDYYLTVDGEQVTERYKFSKVNGTYQWVRVADSGSALAASVAREALGLAGTKATITWGNTLPEAPYNINDMWIKLDGSMYICNHQRLDGETGSQSDWQLFNDTMLRLAKMADDNVITKEEKATLRDTWNQIQKEFTAYQAQATKYGVSITALQNAYNTLNTFLTNTVKIAQDIDSNLSVAQKTEYNQDFANYYSERTAFANVIAQKVADESVGNLQIGMVNLLKGSNVELGAQAYNMGRYYFDKKPEVGKTYTLVTCYTVGENNTHIAAYQDAGNYSINPVFTTKGSEIVESRTFEYVSTRNSDYMTYYQSPNDGTYGSKVHWAVLVEGNKGPNSWIPSQADNDAKAQAIAKAEAELAETKANAYADGIVTEAEQNAINEAQARLDALKIGSVNLVSRKMMLAWNEKNKDIAVWGQDSDGIYLNVSTGRLFDIISTSSYNPVFTLTFKPNTQYVFSVEWKHANQSATGNGLVFYIIYTDGTRDMVILSSDMTIKTRVDLISARDKTILRISSGYGNWSFNALVYSLALYEGNKVLTEIPVATEDLTGQSNVNLLDNSKFQFGTKGYEPNNQSTLNIVNEILQSRSSRTSGTPGVRLPIVHLNQGVYSFKVIVKGINIPSCYIAVYKGDMSGLIASTREYVSILPTFTEKSLTFANSEEGDYRIIIIWNASTATAYPAGLDIEYSMLTAGEIASQGWSPSPGDVAKDIKDVSDAVSNLDTTINTTFKDGIISEAEAKAIASNINVLNAEKADIDAYYTKLYANAYLTGTAKTNLASAKTAYNTAHTNLINSINTAIADGKATATEKADVNAKFTAYNTALSTYKTRVGEADKAIQDQIKALAEQDATNKVDGIDTGTRNLITDRQNVITSGSDVPADTTYSSVLNSKGEREVTVTRAKLDTSTSRYVFINSKLSEQVYPGYYVFSFDYKTNHDGGKIYLDWRNSDHSNALGYSKILENTNGEWKRGWFLCNWTTGTTQNRNLFSVNPTGTSLTNYVAYRNIKLVRGNKGWDDSAAPEDIDQAIQDAIAKTVDITSPSQVFKYGPGYTGTPTPSSIVLTATPRNFTPTSYQWQYLNGSTWTNISGATSSTYSIAPGNTTLFPSGTNVRTFRCICNGDEKLSDSFTIAKLADGATGADGKGVSSTVTTYQASTSGTTAPTGTWSSTIPAVPAGQFLWTRTVINYTSGSPSTMYSVSKIGADGTNGNAGNGVSSTVITYQASTSGTTAPTGTWSSSIPSVAAGQYLWTRTVINYTSGSPSTIYSVGMIGKTGADGKDAYTILLGNESHAFAGSTAAALAGSTTCSVMAYKGATQVAATVGTISGLPTGMTESVASNGTIAPVITFTVTTSMNTASGTVNIPVTVDGKSFTKVFSYSIAFKGDTGATGKGVQSSVTTYQSSTSGTTAPTGTWSPTIPAVAAGSYLWSKTEITYTDDQKTTMYSVARMGTNGTNGNNGNGVSSTVITYQASTSGTTAPTGTWSSSIPSVPAGQYLWTRTVINYTSGSPSTIYSVGMIGKTGADGQPGESINGKMLYRDPEFKVGLNGTRTYGAQNGGGTVVISRTKKSTGQNQEGSLTSTEAAQIKEKLAGSPYSESDWCLYIKCHGGTSTGNLGGFYFGNQSRANAVFIVKVSAKIPVGYTLKNAHYSHGTGYKQEFLTPMVGTGKYETYIFKETCGPTGTFNTVNHLHLSGPVTTEAAPCEWFVDYATVYDQTSDGYADIEIVAKDSFAVQMGYTSFQNMIDQTVAKGGKLVVDGLLNAKLIDVEALAADTAFVNKLLANDALIGNIKANMLSVAGFTFQDHYIFGGKDFGLGPGVKITSIEGDLSFKAYKDASNYISMFYNSASDWGLKGVVGGVELLKLGITNKIGPFTIEGQWLRGSNLALSGSQLSYSYNGHSVHVGSHPDMSTGGNTKLGTFMLSGGSYGGLESYKQVALIVGAPSNNNSYALALTSGLALIKGQVIFNNPTVSANIVVEVGFNSGHFVMLSPVSGNPVVSVNAGLPVGSWFLIGQATAAGGYYYIKLSGSERFNRLGNAYQQINSHNQDPTLIFKVSSTVWLIGNLPVNWIDWNQ